MFKLFKRKPTKFEGVLIRKLSMTDYYIQWYEGDEYKEMLVDESELLWALKRVFSDEEQDV